MQRKRYLRGSEGFYNEDGKTWYGKNLVLLF